jgi:deazaflavin-dependent oxidoreductase (nitroreductase family)
LHTQEENMPLTGEYEPSTAEWARKQAEIYEATGGAEANHLRGVPVIILTTVGAKSGNLRKTALMRVEHEGQYAVVASLGGAPKHPVWYWNVKKHPHVELQDGPVKKDYQAVELEGEERDLWWERAVAVWPDYHAYTQKTDRVIPLFLLSPFEDEQS